MRILGAPRLWAALVGWAGADHRAGWCRLSVSDRSMRSYRLASVHNCSHKIQSTRLYNICSCLFNNLTHCTVQMNFGRGSRFNEPKFNKPSLLQHSTIKHKHTYPQYNTYILQYSSIKVKNWKIDNWKLLSLVFHFENFENVKSKKIYMICYIF